MVAPTSDRPLRALVTDHAAEMRELVTVHGATALRLFGSVARGDEHDSSDVDLLVELLPGTRPFELMRLAVDLEDLLGVHVDVGTPQSLRPEIRDEVLAEAIPL